MTDSKYDPKYRIFCSVDTESKFKLLTIETKSRFMVDLTDLLNNEKWEISKKANIAESIICLSFGK